VHIGIGDPTVVETLTIRAGGATAAASGGQVDKAALAKKQAEIQNMFKDARTLVDAGKFDEAIAAYTKVTEQVQKCAQCFVALGDAYNKKGDAAGAEDAYKKAIDADPTSPDGYAAAATLYNTQRKFDQASAMSAKAMELSAAKGASDPLAVYNQGIILWNQNKFAEAQTQFQKAVELDPKMADAQYWLGMANVNLGKMSEAKKPFEEYLKLAPTGEHADVAKALLAQIK
jgi:tetratricopeptide (TPR) repeat protein